MQTKLVVITLQSSYGNVKAYPRNEQALVFANIAGTRTLTIETLKQITLLGYSIECINGNSLTLSDLTN